MSRLLQRAVLVSSSFALLAAGACGDEPKRRLGSTCSDDGECASGSCYESMCIDPAADDDTDGLVNGTELRLGTDPYALDTDRDGQPDPDELDAATSHLDQDDDGTPDALESQLADRDADCLVDEADPDDDTPDVSNCPEVAIVLGTPSGWYTSEAGRTVTVTVALGADPGRDADIALDAGDEAAAEPASLHFTRDDWDRPRTVTLRGLDDATADGHVDYTVSLAVTSPFLRGATSFTLVNADNDLATTTDPVDDFEGARTSGLWRDEPRHRSDTRVASGALVQALDATGAASPIGGTAGLDVPLDTVARVAARVTLSDATDATGRHEAVLRLLFQPPAQRGTSRQDLVAFEVALGRDALGTRALPRVWSCADPACVTSHPLPDPAPVDAAPTSVAVSAGTAYTLGLALDRQAETITFTIDDDAWTVAFAGGPITAADLVRVDLGAFASPDQGEPLAGDSRFVLDDVTVDGARWDDFADGRLADGRWLDALAWNAVDTGALTLEAQGDLPWFDSHLTLADSADVAGLAARVVVEGAFDPAGDAVGALVGGRFGTAEVTGDTPITGPLEAHVAVSADATTAIIRSVLGTHAEPIAAAELGAAQDVFVAWDGRDLTLQANGVPVLFRPARLGLSVAADAPELGVAVEGAPATRAVRQGRARIDDVATLPAP